MTKPVGILWFRHDLRIHHNPALLAACHHNRLLPVFIWDGVQPISEPGLRYPGAASLLWLHHSLHALDTELRSRGSALRIYQGDPMKVLLSLAQQHPAAALYWNRQYDPLSTLRDSRIKESLRAAGYAVTSFNSSLLCEPAVIARANGEPYRVFTPFSAAVLRSLGGTPSRSPAQADASALPLPGLCPRALPPLPESHSSSQSSAPLRESTLSELNFTPRIRWDQGILNAWQPGEEAARQHLENVTARAEQYSESRDRPDQTGTSRLSPYLHFGELHPAEVWNAALRTHKPSPSVQSYLRQLIWREFAHHLLFHFPRSLNEHLRPAFGKFNWSTRSDHLQAWQKGATGYPLVDAGMAELWATGWMHNRVRMVVGSFLTKHLRMHWLHGASWFMDTLVDADLANNTLGWQWIAGTGADAAPYFRIFNPITQSTKCDPNGHYIRKWLPVLRELPDRWIHAPWQAPAHELRAAGNLRLGEAYPLPIVDHNTARIQALSAFAAIKSDPRGAKTIAPQSK
jgi:deoxyribodipyrimidine photo-lyase